MNSSCTAVTSFGGEIKAVYQHTKDADQRIQKTYCNVCFNGFPKDWIECIKLARVQYILFLDRFTQFNILHWCAIFCGILSPFFVPRLVVA